MSEMIFHKSVYTARSSGYKYRTLATNTVGKSIDVVTQTMKIGDKKRRDAKEDNVFDVRFQELKQLITSKIDGQFEETRKAREMIAEKFEMIEEKVNSMLAFQETVHKLRKDLTAAENTLSELQEKVEKLDVYSYSNSTSTLLYLPVGFDTRDVIQQRGDLALLLGGDYYQNNVVDPRPRFVSKKLK